MIEVALRYERVVNRAFDNIRQAGRGMPAVAIRQLDNLAKIAEYTTLDEQRQIILRQADMIRRSSDEAITEPNDRADVDRRYSAVLEAVAAGEDVANRRRAAHAPGRFDRSDD